MAMDYEILGVSINLETKLQRFECQSFSIRWELSDEETVKGKNGDGLRSFGSFD